MKTITAIMGSMTLLAAMAVHADDDIGIDQALQLQQAGTIKPFEQLNAAALGKHPNGTVGETELEQEYGKYVYKVELRDEQGKQWDVDVDASTGAVLKDREDD